MWCIDCIVLLAIKVASIGFNWIEKKSRFTPWIHPNKTTKHACTPMCNGNRSFSKGMDINELVSVLRISKIPMIKCHMLTSVNFICASLLLICIDKTRWSCVSSWRPSQYKEAYQYGDSHYKDKTVSWQNHTTESHYKRYHMLTNILNYPMWSLFQYID